MGDPRLSEFVQRIGCLLAVRIGVENGRWRCCEVAPLAGTNPLRRERGIRDDPIPHHVQKCEDSFPAIASPRSRSGRETTVDPKPTLAELFDPILRRNPPRIFRQGIRKSRQLEQASIRERG